MQNMCLNTMTFYMVIFMKYSVLKKKETKTNILGIQLIYIFETGSILQNL